MMLRDVKKTITEYIDGLILDDQGQYRTGKIPVIKEAWVREEVEETRTVMVATFMVKFVGADYFANEVFQLDEEKTAYANDLAQNLALFLSDFYDENVPSNGTHGSIANLLKDDNSIYAGGDFAAPVAGWKDLVTSEFGNRTHPVTGEVNSFHSGIDIGLGEGTEVCTAADGTVLFVKKMSTGYGWHLAINHGGKLVTLYAHLSKIFVEEGQEVHKGEPIAESGATGRVTGPHYAPRLFMPSQRSESQQNQAFARRDISIKSVNCRRNLLARPSNRRRGSRRANFLAPDQGKRFPGLGASFLCQRGHKSR